MLRTLLAIFLTAIPALTFAKDVPDFNTLKKNWGPVNSLTIKKSADEKFTAAFRIGRNQASRDMYMITPEKPEMLLWLFHGYKPDGDPYKQSPETFIKNLELKELSSWHNALVIIIDSDASLYSYNPENSRPELQIYCAIYDRLAKQYGNLPAMLIGISSGAEGAVKFAPFVNNLKTLIGISGTYNFDSLAPESGEYKIHIKEYGNPEEWKYEQPLRIIPALKCRLILLAEENSIFRSQAIEAAGSLKMKNVEFIESIGKGKSHNWDFWGSPEVRKIIDREVQATGSN